MSYEVTFSMNGKYIRASVYCDDQRADPSTGIKPENGTIHNLPRDQQRILDRIKLRVDEHVSNCQMGGKSILKKEVTDIILVAAGKKIAPVQLKTVNELLEAFLKGAENGTIHTDKDKVYSDSSIRAIKYAIKAANKTSLIKVPINELQALHFEQFRAKLSTIKTDKKKNNSPAEYYSSNSIKTYNDQLATIIMRAKSMGWHNTDISLVKGRLWAKGEDVDYAIYYNNEELKRIYEHSYQRKSMERIKDVFVFGCYTCLRHSDYYLTDYTMAIDNDILRLKNKKTGNMVNIPLHPIAAKILAKYKNNLPKILYSNLNESVKEMAKQAGFDTKVLFSRIEGGKQKQEYVPKWSLTTTHTMRRSFATNAFIAMMPERMIMKIGGWKTYKSFERYLRLSGIDMAKLMAEQPFYKWTGE